MRNKTNLTAQQDFSLSCEDEDEYYVIEYDCAGCDIGDFVTISKKHPESENVYMSMNAYELENLIKYLIKFYNDTPCNYEHKLKIIEE